MPADHCQLHVIEDVQPAMTSAVADEGRAAGVDRQHEVLLPGDLTDGVVRAVAGAVEVDGVRRPPAGRQVTMGSAAVGVAVDLRRAGRSPTGCAAVAPGPDGPIGARVMASVT